MRAISNSSVLIALSTIGQLDLLNQRFYKGIVIPQAVWREVVETGEGQPGAQEVSVAQCLTVQQITTASIVTVLRMELDGYSTRILKLRHFARLKMEIQFIGVFFTWGRILLV